MDGSATARHASLALGGGQALASLWRGVLASEPSFDAVSDGIERRLSDREPLTVVSDPALITASLIGQPEQRRLVCGSGGADFGEGHRIMATPAFVEGRTSARRKAASTSRGASTSFHWESAATIRARLSDTAKFGQQRVAAPGREQPRQRLCLFGKRLEIMLENGDSEHPIHKVLGTTPRADLPRVRESGSSSQGVR